jgi:hypothetical protein
MCKSTRDDLEQLMGGRDAKGGEKEKAHAEVTESAEEEKNNPRPRWKIEPGADFSIKLSVVSFQ